MQVRVDVQVPVLVPALDHLLALAPVLVRATVVVLVVVPVGREAIDNNFL